LVSFYQGELNMMRIVLVTAVSLFVAPALGQQEAASNTAGGAAVASPIPLGKYNGRVTEQGGTRSSDFDLDLTQNPGTIAIWRAARPCNSYLPISITGAKDGIVRLEQQGGQKGGILGCDRIFELTVSGNELTGSMSGSFPGKFDVKATKQ
jgi:hypothetical protein